MNESAFRFPPRAAAWLCALGIWVLVAPTPVLGCFGARLKVGVGADPALALAAYATGYWVEEKTGIEPEFVALDGAGLPALLAGEIDLYIAPEGTIPTGETKIREAGTVPGVGRALYCIREDVLDDLRFFTVGRALERVPELFGSTAYGEALGSSSPKKAARQAVHRAD